MNEQVFANPLGTERVGKLMIRYAIPSIISIVVNSLYNMVDQIFIGQGVGYLGNAATNIILPVSSILLALGFMIGDGTASYMRSCTNSRRAHLDGKFSASLCQKTLKYISYSCAFLASAVKKFARQSAHFDYWYSF